MSERRICSNCEGAWAKPRGKLCSACYEYERRNGKPRPESVIIAHGRRLMERRLTVRRPGTTLL